MWLENTLWQISPKKELQKLDASEDLILVIGGDGTMIGAIRDLCHLNTPFLGVNIGRLGFLTDLQLGSLEHELPKILKGDYQQESRKLLLLSKVKLSPFDLV